MDFSPNAGERAVRVAVLASAILQLSGRYGIGPDSAPVILELTKRITALCDLQGGDHGMRNGLDAMQIESITAPVKINPKAIGGAR